MKAVSSPNTEPKFYEMEECFEQNCIPNTIVNAITCDDSIDEVQDADMTGEENGELQDSANCCLYEPLPIASQSSSDSQTIVSRRDVVCYGDMWSPFADRSIWAKQECASTFKRDAGPPSSKFKGLVGAKVDADIFSNQAMSLTSLISPSMLQSSRARLPFDFHPEDEFGFDRNDDISDCLDIGILNEEVATGNEEDDDEEDMLSFTGIGIISDDRIARMIDHCNDDVLDAMQPSK